MRNVKKLALLFSILLVSCSQKKTCNIEPIPSEIIDIKTIKGDMVFESVKGRIDTLILTECYDGIDKESINSLLNKTECTHAIGFGYDSKNNFGTIGVWLDKDESKRYSLLINGLCFRKQITTDEKEIIKESTTVIKVDTCDISYYKEISFKEFKIDYFITRDNDVWKPIKFIPKDMKK